MRNTALGTIATRVIMMVSALLIVWLNTHYLGASGQGTASLISLGILLVQALSNFVGGGALVYLAPRLAKGQVLLASFAWAVISAAAFALVFRIVPVVPDEYLWQTTGLGLIQSFFITLLQVTLAREHIRTYNLIVSIQSASAALLLAFFFAAVDWVSTDAYVAALYTSFTITLLLCLLANRSEIAAMRSANTWSTWKELFRLGKFAQGGNVLHLLNHRLNFVFLENLLVNGRAVTGLFSIVLYAGEAIWTVSKSLSVVQYSRISNSQSNREHRQLTNRYLRVSLAVVCCASLAIVFVPGSLYTWLFTEEAAGLKVALLCFIPGIISNGASVIFAHYFSGRGLHYHNMVASGLGLAGAVATAWVMIPRMGLSGASLAASCALVIQCAYFWWHYQRSANVE